MDTEAETTLVSDEAPMREHEYSEPQNCHALLITLPFLLFAGFDLFSSFQAAASIGNSKGGVSEQWVLFVAAVISGVITFAPMLLFCQGEISGRNGLGFMLIFMSCQFFGMLLLDTTFWFVHLWIWSTPTTLAITANLLHVLVCGIPCCLILYRHDQAVRQGIL